MTRENVLHTKEKTLTLFSELDRPGLIHLFINKWDKSETGTSPAADSGLQHYIAEAGLPNRRVLTAMQVHGNRIGIVDVATELGSYSSNLSADALLTNRADIYLSIKVADCLPVYVYDPSSRAIGLIHAGWRGSLLGITERTIKEAQNHLGLKPATTIALLGPSIRSCCYEVSSDVGILFPPTAQQNRKGKHYISLQEVNALELKASGIKASNIVDTNQCTFCNPGAYYSFRRTGQRGERMYAILGLKE